MSSSWSNRTITTLRDGAVEELHSWLVLGNKVFVLHDNLRLTFRVQTQRVNNHTHGDNGTAATAVALPASAARVLANFGKLMEPIYERMYEAFAGGDSPENILSYSDLVRESKIANYHQFAIHNVITTLLNIPSFADYCHRNHKDLQPPTPILPLPTGPDHCLRQHLLGTVPIDELSYPGNIQVVGEVLRQAGLDKEPFKSDLAKTRPYLGVEIN